MKAKKENVRNKSSARRKLIPAISMLTVSAIMLSTATYAWFTMNKEVQMTGLNMTATTGEGMEISLASVTGENVLSFTFADDAKHPSDELTEKGWKSAVDVGDYYSSIAKLKPASTINGVNLFDANDATDGGRKASEFTSVITKADVATRSTLEKNGAISSTGTAGYYVDIPVHLRTSKVDAGQSEKIYYKMKIDNNSTTGELYKAVRVAFLTGSDAASASAIAAVDTSYYGDDETPQVQGVKSANSKSTVTGLSKESVVDRGTFPQTGTGTDTGLTIPCATQSGEFGHLDFIVRVWLEGESKSCYDANAGQQWNIDFAFNMGAFPTSP